MSRTWTKAQNNAIHARGGTVLVSAAAGSGKTAVLVERVIECLTGENACKPSELLIVTFTNAAAAEMREKIYAALSQKIQQDPTNQFLLRQKMALSNAKISTIDSFCGDFVRENFHDAGIAPTFRILDATQKTQMYEEALAQVMEELYNEGDAAFTALRDLFVASNNDRQLEEVIVQIYNYTRSQYSPKQWYQKVLENYKNADEPLTQTPWGKEILNYISSGVTYAKNVLEDSLQQMENDTLYDGYADAHHMFLTAIQTLEQAIATNDWDNIFNALSDFCLPSSIGRQPRGYENKLFSSAIQNRFKEIKTLFDIKNNAALINVMGATQAQHEEDMLALSPVIEKLIYAVERFETILREMKDDVNRYDFSDITHFAIDLLVKEKDGELIKTPLALAYSQQFSEIMLDEYQDTNFAQDVIFWAISKNEENLFMVGDVKQSIYRFRQAMPEIFMRRKAEYTPFDGTSYPTSIILDKNFRSRLGILESTNFVFRNIMSESVGEMAYTKEEELVLGASYPESQIPDAQLHVLEMNMRTDTKEAVEQEAVQIAKEIRKIVDSGMLIGSGDEQRQVTYRDICILVRSVKSNANIFAKAFEQANIPLFSQRTGGFFDTREIQFMLSYFRILDNPLQDIALSSTLMAAPYAFSPDEIAEMRLQDKTLSLYHALQLYAQSGNAKAKQFMADFKKLRHLAIASPPSDLVRAIFSKTACMAIFGAMQGGEMRQANLNKLLMFAQNFEDNGAAGVSDFVRYLEHATMNSDDFSPAATLPETANVVRLMTIHQSKGLEFPVCIVAQCNKRFVKNRASTLALHNQYGIGMQRQKEETLQKFDTVLMEAIKISNHLLDVSEEMRVLYVAMTRAQEKLLLFMTVNTLDKAMQDVAPLYTNNNAAEPFALQKSSSFAQWLLGAFLHHEDAQVLQNYFGLRVKNQLSNFAIAFKRHLPQGIDEASKEEDRTSILHISDDDLKAELDKRIGYKYPYADLAQVSAKLSASKLKEGEMSFEYFASSQPAFMDKTGLTPTQRGVATHQFMQYCQFDKAKENPEKEVERLYEQGFLSEFQAKAVQPNKITAFFKSTTYQRMEKAKQVLREYEFTVTIPAGQYDPALPEHLKEEEIVIQGIADCVFIEDGKAVIVDYKTDRVKRLSELVHRYRDQLIIYRNAIGQCLEVPVKEMLLYSFWLEDVIAV